MDHSVEKQWFDYIEGLGYKEKKTQAIKNYVHRILDNNGIVIIDIHHLAALIGIDEDVLDRFIVHPEKYYRRFTIPKRKGGNREICAPYPALLAVQRWIYDKLLLPNTVLPDSVAGFIPGKSILDNATPHVGSKFILKMDIQDFFPSVSIRRVISVFRGLGYHHRLSYALAALCCYNGVLPQGAPTSPILSNIIAKRLDKRIAGFADNIGLVYTRYADDITLSGEEIKLSHIRFVEKIIREEGFVPNPSKTQLLSPNVKKVITGVSISSGKATIPRNMKRSIRQEAYYIEKYGLRGHMRHEHIEDALYPLRLQGKFAYWKSVEPNNMNLNSSFHLLQSSIRHPKNKWWARITKLAK